ncbi:DNA mismatch endonuclease Vsr [Sinorhizobium meliloti]|uniref:very short patch repair endonuclease n=1 Tax=Rhizobium meliloti TaxID=382 RepID=UPI00142C5AD7|nr:DNA mismatch endonuclease Vsr [Sinorhizobium meliloti]
MDIFTREKRSQVMSRVRGKDTKPELTVRRFLHSRGLRYRLHRRDLPGKPDLVFPSQRIAVFVNGCFWHQHSGCPKSSLPRTRHDFWKAKLQSNILRDQKVQDELRAMNWRPLIVWECGLGLKELELLELKIRGMAVSEAEN